MREMGNGKRKIKRRGRGENVKRKDEEKKRGAEEADRKKQQWMFYWFCKSPDWLVEYLSPKSHQFPAELSSPVIPATRRSQF